jgi:hypothetical protein
MPAVRTLSAMGPTFTKMADAAAKANAEAVERSTRKLGAVVDTEGGRHHIKGKGGKRVPLSSKVDVRAFTTTKGATVVSGAVRGVPQGFWSIVEHGTTGPYIIAPRGTIKGSSRTYFNRALRGMESGTLYRSRRAIKIGGNFRPFVSHPGSKPSGKPWELSMRIGVPLVANGHAWEERKALTKAFTRSI